MLFSDLQTYCLDRLNLATSDTGRVTQIKLILNQVYLQLCAEEALQTGFSTITVSANTSSAALPDGTTGILSLRNGIQVMSPIILQDMAGFVAASAAGSGPGTMVSPLFYSMTSQLVIQVWPTPSVDTTLSALLIQEPAPLVNASDEPSAIADAWQDLLGELAIQRIAVSEEDLWPEQLGNAIAQDLLTRFRAWNMSQQGDSGTTIPLVGYNR